MSKRKALLREKYNATSSGYDELYRDEQFEKYAVVVHITKLRGMILDNGCGTGLLLEYLVSIRKLSKIAIYICLDLSPGMLSKARERVIKLGLGHVVEIVEADAENLPLREKSMDHTVSFTMIDLVEDKLKALKEMDRVTRTAAIVTSLKKAHSIKSRLPNYGRYLGETSKDYVFIRMQHHVSTGSDG